MLNEALKKEVAEAGLAIEEEARKQPVILVFGLGSFGDVIQITALLRALKRQFPGAGLVLLHHDPVGLKLIAGAPYLARAIRLRSMAHYHLRGRLAPGAWDLVVECRYVIKYTLSSTTRLGADEIAFVERAQEVQKPWLGLVQNFPFDNDLLWRAAREKGWSMYDLMAHTAGFAGEDFEALSLPPPLEKPALDKFAFPPRYVVVSNSAEWLPLQSSLWTKSLPHARMRKVLADLKQSGIPTVLMGTANDPGDYAVDHDLRGKTNLDEAAEIIRKARAVMGPEGGLVNLARAVEVPSVVFFGSTPPEFFRLKANINILPRFCGGCWWSTESYLRQCPLLEEIPPCTESLDLDAIVHHVRELFDRP